MFSHRSVRPAEALCNKCKFSGVVRTTLCYYIIFSLTGVRHAEINNGKTVIYTN